MFLRNLSKVRALVCQRQGRVLPSALINTKINQGIVSSRYQETSGTGKWMRVRRSGTENMDPSKQEEQFQKKQAVNLHIVVLKRFVPERMLIRKNINTRLEKNGSVF